MVTLGINYGQLRREVGRYLGFDRDPDSWGSNETQDVADVIDTGLRQFQRPPRLPDEHHAHQWSFLRPFGFLTMVPGEWDYDLPEDFAGLDGLLYYVQIDHITRSIQIVNEPRILQLRQRNWYTTTTYEPKIAAITPKHADGVSQGTYRIMFWPKPDEPYTVQYKYFARQNALRSDKDVPLGGSEHAETVRSSCIAAAESHLDDETGGPKWKMFLEQLRASVDFDRKANSPHTLGYNGDYESRELNSGCNARSIGGVVTHEAISGGGEGENPEQSIAGQDGGLIGTQGGDPLVIQP